MQDWLLYLLMKKHFLLSITAGIAMSAGALHAQIIPISLTGNTQYDGWADFGTITGSYGSNPGTVAWNSGAIGSNTGSSGDAAITKGSNGTAGGPYKGGGSIYFGGFSATPNTNGGSVIFSDTSVVGSLKTLVFQLDIGEAFGHDFFNDNTDIQLTLQTNGAPVVLSADYFTLLGRVDTGEVFDPGTGPEPIYRNTYGWQWDFTSLYATDGFAITGYSLTVNAVQHAQIYAAQLDQGDTFAQVVPEPSTYALMALGLGLIVWKNRRRLVKSAS